MQQIRIWNHDKVRVGKYPTALFCMALLQTLNGRVLVPFCKYCFMTVDRQYTPIRAAELPPYQHRLHAPHTHNQLKNPSDRPWP